MNSKIKPLIEGGLLAALTTILSLASIYLPIIGMLLEFFCAVPIVVLTARQGVKIGAVAVFVSTIMLFMFVGPFLAIRITLSFGLCGLVLGQCLRLGFNAVKCFIPTLAVSFVAQLVSLGMLIVFFGVDVVGENQQLIRESFDESFKIYESMGVDPEVIGYSKAAVESIIQLMTLLLPIILFFTALINAAGSYLLSKMVFRKLHMKFAEPLPPFKKWRFPLEILYVAAFAVIGIYWGETRQFVILYYVSANALVLSILIGLVQGLSVFSYVAEKYKISKILYGIFCVLVCLNFMLMLIVSITGLFDIAFDYRKRLEGKS